MLDADPGAADAAAELDGLGLRYLTVQVRDVVREHARLVDLGYESAGVSPSAWATPPASRSSERPTDINEISQRASLTGPLPVLS